MFPGLGLGIMLSGARTVTEEMLTEAALALADYVDGPRLSTGGVYPQIDKLRGVSKHLAVAVIKHAVREGIARVHIPEDIDSFVEDRLWKPVYLPICQPKKDTV